MTDRAEHGAHTSQEIYHYCEKRIRGVPIKSKIYGGPLEGAATGWWSE